MTKTEFCDRLSKRYSNNYSDIAREDLENWIFRYSVTDVKLEVLYSRIIENYKYSSFPSIQFVADCFSIGGETYESDWSKYQPDYIIKKTKHWPVKRIIDKVYEIQGAGTTRASEVLFVGTWQELSCIRAHLKDLQWEDYRIEKYLEKIKSAIINKEKIFFDVEYQKSIIEQKERANREQTIGEIIGGVR